MDGHSKTEPLISENKSDETLSVIVRHIGNAVLPTGVFNGSTGFYVLEDGDNLVFGVTAFTHEVISCLR
jgi:hypothetical protein